MPLTGSPELPSTFRTYSVKTWVNTWSTPPHWARGERHFGGDHHRYLMPRWTMSRREIRSPSSRPSAATAPTTSATNAQTTARTGAGAWRQATPRSPRTTATRTRESCLLGRPAPSLEIITRTMPDSRHGDHEADPISAVRRGVTLGHPSLGFPCLPGPRSVRDTRPALDGPPTRLIEGHPKFGLDPRSRRPMASCHRGDR